VRRVPGFSAHTVRQADGRVFVDGHSRHGAQTIGPVDRIVVATGQRPDLAMTRELRLELDPWLESVRALGPLIDPNIHSCGTVPPHGHRELSHPEPGFYTIGVKSYGRAPTFLLLTGYEQARSVAAARPEPCHPLEPGTRRDAGGPRRVGHAPALLAHPLHQKDSTMDCHASMLVHVHPGAPIRVGSCRNPSLTSRPRMNNLYSFDI